MKTISKAAQDRHRRKMAKARKKTVRANNDAALWLTAQVLYPELKGEGSGWEAFSEEVWKKKPLLWESTLEDIAFCLEMSIEIERRITNLYRRTNEELEG